MVLMLTNPGDAREVTVRVAADSESRVERGFDYYVEVELIWSWNDRSFGAETGRMPADARKAGACVSMSAERFAERKQSSRCSG